jgi:hypothetical protein
MDFFEVVVGVVVRAGTNPGSCSDRFVVSALFLHRHDNVSSTYLPSPSGFLVVVVPSEISLRDPYITFRPSPLLMGILAFGGYISTLMA